MIITGYIWRDRGVQLHKIYVASHSFIFKLPTNNLKKYQQRLSPTPCEHHLSPKSSCFALFFARFEGVYLFYWMFVLTVLKDFSLLFIIYSVNICRNIKTCFKKTKNWLPYWWIISTASIFFIYSVIFSDCNRHLKRDKGSYLCHRKKRSCTNYYVSEFDAKNFEKNYANIFYLEFIWTIIPIFSILRSLLYKKTSLNTHMLRFKNVN